jgi:hypothetical protein
LTCADRSRCFRITRQKRPTRFFHKRQKLPQSANGILTSRSASFSDTLLARCASPIDPARRKLRTALEHRIIILDQDTNRVLREQFRMRCQARTIRTVNNNDQVIEKNKSLGLQIAFHQAIKCQTGPVSE